MPPKQVVAKGAQPEKGFISSAYDELTSPENATIVRSIVVFGVCCSIYL